MPSTPRGTRDFSPSEAIFLRWMIATAEDVFKRFGFYPIDTPSIESTETLTGKAYGEEFTKEIYVMGNEDAGLRYDLTVPLARYMAMNRDVPLPFKRYQIDKAWRKDEPQKMRNREFYQADVDVVGTKELTAEAECVAACALAIEAMGVTEYNILINSRITLDAILAYFGIPQAEWVDALRVIDKMEKISKSDVVQQLAALGPQKNADQLVTFIKQEGENEDKLKKLGVEVPAAKEEAGRLLALLGMLESYNLRANVIVDFSLARGFAYYTGMVFEFTVIENGKRLPSVAGGGRYDNLMGFYMKSETSIPAVGCSIGINRLFDILVSKRERAAKTYAKAFIAYIGAENLEYALKVSNVLRASGVCVDLNMTTRSLGKQLEYANSLGIDYAVIVGNAEKQAAKVKIRDMRTGAEEMMSVDDAAEKFKV